MIALIVAAVMAVTPAEYIHSLHPELSPKRTTALGKHIERWAAQYDVDPKLLVAILKQESDFRPGLLSCYVVHRYKACFVSCDYGVAQINALWIKKWRLDAQRLRYDDGYNIGVAARILAMLQREYAADEPDWYGRYHSGTPSKKALYLSRLDSLED